jgi:hypothetical protein
MPVLEYKPARYVHGLLARHVMTADPVMVPEVVRVGDVYDMLKGNKHNGFPVVGEPFGASPMGADGEYDYRQEVFKGMIKRQVRTLVLPLVGASRRCLSPSPY